MSKDERGSSLMRWFIFLPQYVQPHFFFEKNKEIRYNKSVISGRNSPEDKERRIKCISLILMM